MRQSRFLAIPVICLALVGLSGCDESDSGALPPQDEFQSAELAAFSFDDALDSVEDATLEAPMAFAGNLHHAPWHGRGPNAGPLLRRLGLRFEQRLEILSAFREFRQCMQEPIQAFREANQAIVQDANEQRAAIVDAWRNGEISGEDARARLHELNLATREAIRSNPANEPIREAMCDCRTGLFDGIRSVLDPDQQVEWDAWVAGHDGPCVAGEA